MHQDDQHTLVANLPTSGKVVGLERVALADAREAVDLGERKLVRRAALLSVRQPRQETANAVNTMPARRLPDNHPLPPDHPLNFGAVVMSRPKPAPKPTAPSSEPPLHPDETAVFMRPYGTTPVGQLVSPATSLFTPPFGCTLLFTPAADFTQLDAMVREVSGRELALLDDAEGFRNLLLTCEEPPAVRRQALRRHPRTPALVLRSEPVTDPAEVENALVRALVRVTPRGQLVLVALQLNDLVEDD